MLLTYINRQSVLKTNFWCFLSGRLRKVLLYFLHVHSTRDLKFGTSLYFYTYLMYQGSEGSGHAVPLHSLV